jgi:hypothetical protein
MVHEASWAARAAAEAGRADRSLNVGDRNDADRSVVTVDDDRAPYSSEGRLLEEVGDVFVSADQQRWVSIGPVARRHDAAPCRKHPLQLTDAQ